MSNYLYFTNYSVTFSIMANAAPNGYADFATPIFCDLDNENLRFIVDYWRNNCTLTCKEQQLYDLVRLKMDHFDSKQSPITVTVGHRTFTTTEASLVKLPYFEAAIRNKQDFQVNVDRDPILFQRLLSYCRHPLQHPLHKVDVPAEDFAFYGLCPKYLRLWDKKEVAETTATVISEEMTEKYRDYNSMWLVHHHQAEISMFIQNFYRYLPFTIKTIFLEESEREVDKEFGDSVYFTSESIDCSYIDAISNFFIVCESDVEVTSIEQIFTNLYATFYACNANDNQPRKSFRKQLVKLPRPAKTRHAEVMLGTGYGNRNKLYVGKQKECRFEFYEELDEIANPTHSDCRYESNGAEVTVSTSAALQQCLWDLAEMSSFMCQKRGNKYYVTIPLHTFFSNGPKNNCQFFTLRNQFHFQMRLDGVKVDNMRIMTTVFQMSEEEHDAMQERENEYLTIMQYKVFSETCESGTLKKEWIAGKPYAVRYFLLQVRDSDSGERLICNLKGKFTIGDDVTAFNIHTNQAAQSRVLQMQKHNPYLWIIPFFIQPSLQPTGCCLVTSDMKMAVEVECDLQNVEIDCWMSCFRVLGQNFVSSLNPCDGARNCIGFLRDFDIKSAQPQEEGKEPESIRFVERSNRNAILNRPACMSYRHSGQEDIEEEEEEGEASTFVSFADLVEHLKVNGEEEEKEEEEKGVGEEEKEEEKEDEEEDEEETDTITRLCGKMTAK